MMTRPLVLAILALAMVVSAIVLLQPRQTPPGESAVSPESPGGPGGTSPAADDHDDAGPSALPDEDAGASAVSSAADDADDWYDPDSRTSAGLREPKVEMRLPIVDPATQPPIAEQVERTREIVSRLSVPAQVDPAPHPLDQSNQVIETGDGPRGPNPIEPDPNAPGPAGVLPARPDSVDQVTDVEPTRRFDPGGPEVEVPDDLAALPGPGQGVFDPDDPGPDETQPRSSD